MSDFPGFCVFRCSIFFRRSAEIFISGIQVQKFSEIYTGPARADEFDYC